MSERISAADVHRRTQSGEELLLVCAYDDERKCRDLGLQRSLTLREFQGRLGSLPPDREIVFWCA